MLLCELVFLENSQNCIHILVEIRIILKALLNEKTELSARKQSGFSQFIAKYLPSLHAGVLGTGHRSQSDSVIECLVEFTV